GEAVQSVMRTLGVQGTTGMDNPYERLKDLTRGHRVDGEGMREFIGSLGLPDAERDRLLALSPHTYVGYAAALVGHLDDVDPGGRA
ncbi:MAG: adenylosuccinate lyase, partial [Brachybacterium tyrofermentans]